MKNEKWLSVQQAAKQIGISRQTLYNVLAEDKTIPTRKRKGRLQVDVTTAHAIMWERADKKTGRPRNMKKPEGEHELPSLGDLTREKLVSGLVAEIPVTDREQASIDDEIDLIVNDKGGDVQQKRLHLQALSLRHRREKDAELLTKRYTSEQVVDGLRYIGQSFCDQTIEKCTAMAQDIIKTVDRDIGVNLNKQFAGADAVIARAVCKAFQDRVLPAVQALLESETTSEGI